MEKGVRHRMPFFNSAFTEKFLSSVLRLLSVSPRLCG
jgi:hypothetical protein